MRSLNYDPGLMSAGEQAFLVKAWDDSTVLPDPDPRKEIVVAVHDGMPHGDDVLCVALLRVLSGFRVKWVRTRDPQKLEICDLRCDVGEGLLDHHGARAEKGVAACSRVLDLLEGSCPRPKEVWENLEKLVDETASLDSGASTFDPNPWVHAGSVAEMAKPGWGHGGCGPMGSWQKDEPDYDRLFDRLVGTMTMFVDDIVAAGYAAAEAREVVAETIAAAKDDQVVVFPPAARLADVKKALWEAKSKALYYVQYFGFEDWRVLCAADPEAQYAFNNSRRLIPERFRGLRGGALADAADLDDAVFCHIAGFIAGFATAASAEKFARLCLDD